MQKDERFIPLNEAEKYFKTSWQNIAQGALALKYFFYYSRRGQIFVVHPVKLEELYNGDLEVPTRHHVKTKDGNIIPHKCFYKDLLDNSSAPKKVEEFFVISLGYLSVRMSDEDKIFHYLGKQHDTDLSRDEYLRRALKYLDLANGKDPSRELGKGGNASVIHQLEVFKKNYPAAIEICILAMEQAAGKDTKWKKISQAQLIDLAKKNGYPGRIGRDIHAQLPDDLKHNTCKQ